jgi:hypothetical protein
MAQAQRVKATRNFRHKFEDLGVGSVLDLDLPTAQELRNGNRVEFVASDTKLAKCPVLREHIQAAPEDNRVAALEMQIAGLAASIEKLTAAAQLPAAAKRAPKETANA